jgi:hypothetical protein
VVVFLPGFGSTGIGSFLKGAGSNFMSGKVKWGLNL